MSREDRKPVFRDHCREYAEETLKEPFDRLNDVQRSKWMARFFADRVLRPKNPTLLPFAEEDINACVVDGKGDQSVDFISREDGVVVIVQAKYSGDKKLSKRPREDPQDLDSFRNVLTRLRAYRSRQMAEAIRELAAEINWETDRFQLYYITLRQLAADQQEIASTGVTLIPELPDLSDRAELQLLDESMLNKELRDSLSVDDRQSERISLLFAENPESEPWIKIEDDVTGRACYVGRISGAQLANLFEEHRSRLFTLNLRNYIGDTSTNKNIRNTAITSPTDFFFFNNGISALATRIEVDPRDKTKRSLLCHDFSVVNGAQTVRSLYRARPDSHALRDVHVLLRVTEFRTKKTSAEQDFLDNVTKYNNTQNAIRLSDFRSNDKIQYDIRRRFSDLPSVGGRKFSYKNKRSAEREQSTIPIGMEEFIKTIFAFLYGPDDVHGGTGHVFDATKGGGYAKLFGDGDDILPALTNENFERYAGIWLVCSFAKDLWRARVRESRDAALERRWMFYYALGEAMRLAYSSQAQDFLKAVGALSNPSWTREPNEGAVKKAISRFSNWGFNALSSAYKVAEGKSGFTHRNWFRSSSTLEQISSNVANSWGLLSEHAEDYVLPKPR